MYYLCCITITKNKQVMSTIDTKLANTKKITKATFKSFLSRHEGHLYVKVRSSFSGMSDMVEQVEDSFDIAVEDTHFPRENSLGVSGVYLVGGSRDYFDLYEDDNYYGIKVYNSCGSFIVAIRKQEPELVDYDGVTPEEATTLQHIGNDYDLGMEVNTFRGSIQYARVNDKASYTTVQQALVNYIRGLK